MYTLRLRHKFYIITIVTFLVLLLGASGVWAQASDPDLNNDGVVNILDVSMVGSCFGQDPSNPPCDVADTDGDGDVDFDDINFVVASFGQTGFPTGEADTTPPDPPIVFDVTSPTRLRFQAIAGEAEAESRIDIVGGQEPVSVETFANSLYMVNVPLQRNSVNTLFLTATDAAGNTSAPIEVTIV